jgi:thiol-disulfide isomerase/thioredoxin
MKSLRGKVVVIQTFNLKSGTAKALPDRVAKALAEFKPEDVQIIAIHSPEGADKAESALKARPDMLVGIDRDGAFHDLIGAYKHPVNVVIDRIGNVKEAGLTTDGLVDYVTELVAEPRDTAQKPTEKQSATSAARKDFPTFSGAIDHATDLRGKTAPRLPNVQWMWNRKPDTTNRLLILDFWATWCGPCKQAIPHMNEIAKKFGRDVACAGISDEAPNSFEKGLRSAGLAMTSFDYCIGTDPTGSMKKAFGISGIPHIAVISSDNIVRWQGHPDGLTPSVVQELVDANRSLLSVNDKGSVGDRWKRDIDAEKDRGGGSRRKGY